MSLQMRGVEKRTWPTLGGHYKGGQQNLQARKRKSFTRFSRVGV